MYIRLYIVQQTLSLLFSRRVGDFGFVEGDAFELCCYVGHTPTYIYTYVNINIIYMCVCACVCMYQDKLNTLLALSRRVGDLGFVEGDAFELCCYLDIISVHVFIKKKKKKKKKYLLFFN